MKRYLTAVFVGISIISVFVGFTLDVRWNGIVSWGLALIFLLIAAYFTKYIPNESKDQDDPHKII